MSSVNIPPGAYTEQSGVSARDSTAAASAMPAMQEQCRDAQEERARHFAGAVARECYKYFVRGSLLLLNIFSQGT